MYKEMTARMLILYNMNVYNVDIYDDRYQDILSEWLMNQRQAQGDEKDNTMNGSLLCRETKGGGEPQMLILGIKGWDLALVKVPKELQYTAETVMDIWIQTNQIIDK